jgi:hypothetical protein
MAPRGGGAAGSTGSSHTTPGEPPRPTTPQLLSTHTSWPGREGPLKSVELALDDPQMQLRLGQAGISPNSVDVDARGQGTVRGAKLTPLLELGWQDAGARMGQAVRPDQAPPPLNPRMAPMAEARYRAWVIRETLHQVPAFDRDGQARTDSHGMHRKLGTYEIRPTTPSHADKDPVIKREAAISNRLSAAYVVAVDAGGPIVEQRLSPAQRAALLKPSRGQGSINQFQARFAQFIVELRGHGPQAAAFLTHAAPTGETFDHDGSRKRGVGVRDALLEVLRASPQAVQRLVDAAHADRLRADGSGTELALTCKALRAQTWTASFFADPVFGPTRKHVASIGLNDLWRAQGGSPSPGLQWLLAQPASPPASGAAVAPVLPQHVTAEIRPVALPAEQEPLIHADEWVEPQFGDLEPLFGEAFADDEHSGAPPLNQP